MEYFFQIIFRKLSTRQC